MSTLTAPRPTNPSLDPHNVVSLAIPPDVRLDVSYVDFEELCRNHRELRLERTAEGELIVMAPAATDSGGRNARLTQRLGNWSDAGGKGRFVDSSTGYCLPNGAIRSPDASWIRNDRSEEKAGFAPICPVFAVKLRLPCDDRGELQQKLHEYLTCGARLGWLIDPMGGTVETLKKPATLSGEDVPPGFVLDLQGILVD